MGGVRNRLLRFVVYALLGVAVGLVVAGVDYVAIELLLDPLAERPIWQVALAPFVGLAVTAAILQWPGRSASPATSEDLIAAYHDRHDRLRLAHLPARLAAGIATIGSGGALGLEGPSIYTGGTIGASMQTRARALFADKDNRMLMVAGAAAGVAAIFKTPATGVLFALEVPYKGDVARRALLPALIASATSYLTFVTLIGTKPIFEVDPAEFIITDDIVASRVLDVSFDLPELAAAAFIGLFAGAGALVFARLLKRTKEFEQKYPWWQRWLVASAVLGGLAVASDELFGHPLSIGPNGGDFLFEWITGEEATLGLLAMLFVMRLAGTMSTSGGGGVGGVFIPLVIQGLILGRLFGIALVELDLTQIDEASARILFPAIGLAAFLGAGYRTPLASVMFVAESTGQAGFVVPALVATAVSQVVMGSTSVSSFQRDTRSGHLEQRLTLPITSALVTGVHTVRPDVTIAQFVWEHALRHRELDMPVVDDDGRFVGMAHLADANQIDREHWSDLTVAEMMRTSPTTGRMNWTLRQATELMEREEIEVLPIIDRNDGLLGVVTGDAIVRLDEILSTTEQ